MVLAFDTRHILLVQYANILSPMLFSLRILIRSVGHTEATVSAAYLLMHWSRGDKIDRLHKYQHDRRANRYS